MKNTILWTALQHDLTSSPTQAYWFLSKGLFSKQCLNSVGVSEIQKSRALESFHSYIVNGNLSSFQTRSYVCSGSTREQNNLGHWCYYIYVTVNISTLVVVGGFLLFYITNYPRSWT